MKIYLIRHGMTQANLNKLYCGSTDIPLSDQGREALKRLSYEVGDVDYITSGMLRTEQTLELLFGPVPHRVEPGFREIDFGAFEMKGYEMLKNDPEYQAWLAGDNMANTPPGGESGIAMADRAVAAFHALERDTVVVSHGGVIAAIMASLFPEENRTRYSWQPKPGYGYCVEGGSYRTIP